MADFCYNEIMKTSIKFFIIILIASCPAIAFCMSSVNFQADPDENIDASKKQTSSSNYKIWGSIEPIVGESGTGDKKVLHGSVLKGEAEAAAKQEPTPGGPGPDSRLVPPTPNFDEIDPDKREQFVDFRLEGILVDNIIQTYADKYLLQGTKSYWSQGPWINDSRQGVINLTNTEWRNSVYLDYGKNEFSAYTKNKYGASEKIHLIVKRRLPGDVNDNYIVNDYDLSLFTTQWKKTGLTGWQSDFNMDRIVDDYDLSILAAYWQVQIKLK